MQEDDANPQAGALLDAKAPLKLSFTVSKSSSASRPPLFPKTDRRKEADDREFVSEFDGKGRDCKAPVRVIPLPEKSWRPEKRMKNIMVASEGIPATEERFESETLAAGPQPSVEYGLQLRKSSEETAEIVKLATESVQARESQKCREDLALLPDESSMDAYEDVPIEEFGEALLRGMGWETGKPIGRNAKTVAVPFEAARKSGREGLGAIPAPQPEKVKKYIKPGESRKNKITPGRVMCVIAGKYAGSRGQIAEVNGGSYTIALFESGKRLHVKESELAEVGSSEEEKARKKLSMLHIEKDRDLETNGHQHSHSTGKERKKDHTNDREVRRDGYSSEDDMEVERGERRNDRHRKDERYRSSKEEDKHTYPDGDSNKGNRGDHRDENRGHGKIRVKDSRDEKRRGRKEESKEVNRASDSMYERGGRRADAKGYASEDRNKEASRSSKLEDTSKSSSAKGRSLELPAADTRIRSWLARDIRVRIIDKRAYGEKLYLQKGCVVDVVSPSICDIQLDNGGKILQEVKQEDLETALPKRGGRVLVVGGKYRGQVGKLQERDSDKGVGLVQMEETYEILTLNLDHLAEFVGAIHDMKQ